jgi:probable H4MPT-linked C1 transfer pathway protein
MTSSNKQKNKPPAPPSNPWLGIDIGGANLKLALCGSAGTPTWAASIPFPMWKQSEQLATTLATCIDDCPEFHAIALTMTGELADCFATRAEGVAKILEQVTRLFPAPLVYVYGVDGQWRSPAQAARDPWITAASNWHALANWSRRFLQANQHGVVVDIGSTTIDIVGISPKNVLSKSKTDSDRLKRHELIYTGVERSNLAGLVRSVPLHGKRCPVMNELFATTRDAYVWMRYLDEAPDDCDTCDSRPMTRLHARFRLARLVGEDGSTITDTDIDAIAKTIHQKQSRLLRRGLEKVLTLSSPTTTESNKPVSTLICSGHGEFLVREALKDGTLANRFGITSRCNLSEKLGPDFSRVAPALAVAQLAQETSELQD